MTDRKTRILHIDSSARSADSAKPSHNSISRQLASTFVQRWQALKPDTEITYRDVATQLPPILDQAWIDAAFTDESERSELHQQTLAPSDALIAEYRQADVIVMSAPMYNYGMPAPLKAWFDQVIREGETISFDLSRGDFPIRSTLKGKTLVLLTSSGEYGFEAGGEREGWDHLGAHVRLLATEFLGVNNFHQIRSEYQEFGDQRHEESKAAAFRHAAALAEQLVAGINNSEDEQHEPAAESSAI